MTLADTLQLNQLSNDQAMAICASHARKSGKSVAAAAKCQHFSVACPRCPFAVTKEERDLLLAAMEKNDE